MPRRAPSNNLFRPIAPFIAADTERQVFVGRHRSGWVIVRRGQPDLYVKRQDALSAYNAARAALSDEREIKRLRDWRNSR